MDKFIGEKIEVNFDRKPGPPTSFVWRERKYIIEEVVDHRLQLEFSKRWWQRRHRDYYQVKTTEGDLFEIYFNRGPGKRYWVLYKTIREKDLKPQNVDGFRV